MNREVILTHVAFLSLGPSDLGGPRAQVYLWTHKNSSALLSLPDPRSQDPPVHNPSSTLRGYTLWSSREPASPVGMEKEKSSRGPRLIT